MTTNNCSSSTPLGYTEEIMAQAFEHLLLSKNGLPTVGVFAAIYREITCQQGRPDFIALRYPTFSKDMEHMQAPGLVGPEILQNLKHKAPRTFNYLAGKSQFSSESIRNSLRRLMEKGYVEQVPSGSYRLAANKNPEKPEIWSFELKLNNPKRAVFQAQQSRAYAERAIVVVPPGQERNYERFRETMQRWHIGLATFDPLTGIFRFVRKGRRSHAFSPSQKIYTLSQIASRYE